jgi:hypothetical protein
MTEGQGLEKRHFGELRVFWIRYLAFCISHHDSFGRHLRIPIYRVERDFLSEKFPPAKMLQFYAERFPTTEINYTFYRIPNSKTMGAWDSATPEHFRFGLKAPQKVTHISKLQKCEEYMGIFQRVILGLGSKLGPVLFQLPPTFKKDAALLNDFLGSPSSGMRVAFEFRHVSWLDDEIFVILKNHKAALCIAETSDSGGNVGNNGSAILSNHRVPFFESFEIFCERIPCQMTEGSAKRRVSVWATGRNRSAVLTAPGNR